MANKFNLLQIINFDDLEDGEYTPIVRARSLSRRASLSTDSFEAESLPAGFGGFSPASVDSPENYESPKSAKAFRAAVSAPKKRPVEVEALEKILSSAYDSNVTVTKIRTLPATRKEVKEVFYMMNGGISKVWVFKADPKKTAIELNAYHVVYNQGIPTGKPILHDLNAKKLSYDFDIAILGGIVQHAGDPYTELIRNIELRPDIVFKTASSVANLIADYHIKLTLAKTEFEKYGVEVPKASPRNEIKERFVAGLNISESVCEKLISACESLYNKQSGLSVISHGDIHLGNIVTTLVQDAFTGQMLASVDKFGVIDWGSIAFDHPYSDLHDFWLHHVRHAKAVCGDYDFDFEQFEQNYLASIAEKAKAHDLSFDLSKKNSLIESALWNLYEMFDPVRKDESDIQSKAVTHCSNLLNDLSALNSFGCKKETDVIKKELRTLLNDKLYLKEVIID